MSADRPIQLAELAELQCGVLTADQALSSGLTRALLKSRVQQRRWQRMYRGVYATFSGEPSRQAVLWAAVLSAGRGAMLSYKSAAELDSLTDEPSRLVHVTVPIERRVRKTPGLVVHRSARADAAKHPVLTPPRTRVEETILDLAGTASTLDEAVGWVTKGLGRRLTNQPRLRAAMQLRTSMRWRTELSELLSDDMYGVLSVLEYRHVRYVERPHRLPNGQRQARFRRNGRWQYRDVLYEAYCLGLELDGQNAHPAESRWQDIWRDNAAAVDGIATLRFGWLDITTRPCEVAAQIAAVLSQRGYAKSRPCSPTCPVAHIGAQRRQRRGA